jgi:hypothetical protein
MKPRTRQPNEKCRGRSARLRLGRMRARAAIRIRDQPDDLKHHIPLATGGKASGEFLKTACLIAGRLPNRRTVSSKASSFSEVSCTRMDISVGVWPDHFSLR